MNPDQRFLMQIIGSLYAQLVLLREQLEALQAQQNGRVPEEVEDGVPVDVP